jgi:hypothetical protein
MTPPDTLHQRYLRRLLAVLFAGVAWLALFNIALDTYGIFRARGLPTLDTLPVVWSRVSAAERLADDCQVALLGSSRVMHGFGPELPKWGNRKVCNGAIGGTSMVEQRAVFDWVLRQKRTRHVILFIDFHMFHDDRGLNADFPQSRFNPDRSRLTYLLWAATSLDAVRSGIRMTGRPIPFLDQVRGPVGPVRGNKTELYRFLRNPSLFLGWSGPDKSVAILESILDDAESAGLQVVLVIPPIHAMLLETMHMTGVWEINKEWRRQLTELTAHRMGRPVPLWDFTTFHTPATSPMPLSRHDPINPWWIDVSHQSSELGWLTMARIRDAYAGSGQEWHDEFGVLLTPDNIDEHLRRLDRGRRAWIRDNPEQAQWLYEYAEELAAAGAQPYDERAEAAEPGSYVPDEVLGTSGDEEE